jgi:type III restriction enzyme
MKTDWKDKGNKDYLLAKVIRVVENFIRSERMQITPPLFNLGNIRKRIIITLNMNKVVQHIWEAIRMGNTENFDLVLDTEHPIRSIADMMTWYTSQPWEYTHKSHINRCVLDRNWKASEAFELYRNEHVTAWVKNDHPGFAIYYTYQGVTHTFWPDSLVKLINGTMLVLEVKGKDNQQNRTKREFLDE